MASPPFPSSSCPGLITYLSHTALYAAFCSLSVFVILCRHVHIAKGLFWLLFAKLNFCSLVPLAFFHCPLILEAASDQLVKTLAHLRDSRAFYGWTFSLLLYFFPKWFCINNLDLHPLAPAILFLFDRLPGVGFLSWKVYVCLILVSIFKMLSLVPCPQSMYIYWQRFWFSPLQFSTSSWVSFSKLYFLKNSFILHGFSNFVA